MIRWSLYLRDGCLVGRPASVPAAWIADTDGGPDSRQAFAASPDGNPMPGRDVPQPSGFPAGSNVALCVGMCGRPDLHQLPRRGEVVATKLSPAALP